MSSFTVEEILDHLRRNIISVTFTKADKTIRYMRCTLDPTIIPETPPEKMFKEEKYPNGSKGTFRVWDVDKNEWRSFKLDSVLSLYYATNKTIKIKSLGDVTITGNLISGIKGE